MGCPAQAGEARRDEPAATGSADYPILTSDLQPVDKDLLAELYQYDATPIAGRMPLLLLHGGGGESRPFFRRDRIATWLNANTTFPSRYKIYLLRYNASTVLDESVPHVKVAIKDFYARVGKPIVALGYSLGGNVLQRVLLDSDLDPMIELVVTMGTPFRGSPLLTSGLMLDWQEFFATSITFLSPTDGLHIRGLRWSKMRCIRRSTVEPFSTGFSMTSSITLKIGDEFRRSSKIKLQDCLSRTIGLRHVLSPRTSS